MGEQAATAAETPPKADQAARYRSLRRDQHAGNCARSEGQADEAAQVLRGLGELYRDDPAAQRLLNQP
ncbi:MAG: hypothetical protein U0736_01975 [Gemmataceae bacterium]